MREALPPSHFQGSLGVVRPLGASRLVAGLAHCQARTCIGSLGKWRPDPSFQATVPAGI